MVSINPSAGYTITVRVMIHNVPGMLGRITTAIGGAGGLIDAVDLVEHRGRNIVRDITVKCRDEAHGLEVADAVRDVPQAEVLDVVDRVFEMHLGGKISIRSKFALRSRDDLSMAYTPGVGRVSMAIAESPEKVYDLTIKRNSVAVLTDGSAVLGLGNIGPEAALPVMEGKAMLFKEFANIDAYPVCVKARSIEHLIETAAAIAPGFGGMNLEDIAAPACFEVEERLTELLDIPIFHDDQHGTAVVVLASLLNAARCLGKRFEDMRVVVLGMGASGIASARLLLKAGIGDVVGVDRSGIVHRERTENMNPQKEWMARNANRDDLVGELPDALRGADVFLGLSGPGLVQPAWLGTMKSDAIVFALANPVPEIMPEEMPANIQVIATGRSDYPNQINNVLVFPGFFRGLLDCRAQRINDDMKLAAGRALAGLVPEEELEVEYIIPSVFDRRVAPTVAEAVMEAAAESGLARITPPPAEARV
jgi:malate dehydrogenase (oxaloacetate-decarboxylating)